MSRRILEKAARLVAEGRVCHLSGDFYSVIGDSQAIHEVDMLKEACTCRPRGNCSHVEAARIFRSRATEAMP